MEMASHGNVKVTCSVETCVSEFERRSRISDFDRRANISNAHFPFRFNRRPFGNYLP